MRAGPWHLGEFKGGAGWETFPLTHWETLPLTPRLDSVIQSFPPLLIRLFTYPLIHSFIHSLFRIYSLSFIGLFIDSSSFFLPLTYCCSLFTHPSFIPHSVTRFLICSFILLLTNLFIRLILMGQALYLDDAGATGGPRQTPFLSIEGSRIRRGKRTYLQTVTSQGGLGCYEGV